MAQPLPTAPVLVFDIETCADIAAARRLYPNLATLDDAEALLALQAMQHQATGRAFMPLPLHRIVCLSAWYVQADQITLFSLSAQTLSEKDILRKFFKAFEQFDALPQLVSWNGSGFDLPVIIYRAMQYELNAPLLFTEDAQKSMRFNNYVNRFHERHLDLMDRMSGYGASRRQPLDLVASLYGLPGKSDVDGSMVATLVADAQWDTLSQYCESDVINTWLVYLRWLRLTGKLSHDQYDYWQQHSRDYLATLPQHESFLTAWQA